MFTQKNIKKTYNPKIVSGILLLTMMLTGISIVEDRHIVIAQSNNTQNVKGNLTVEKESTPSKSDLKSSAKITNDEAIQIALKNASAQQSDLKGVELENENGNLVYSVNIVHGNESKDVKVGAIDGKILGIENDDLEGEDNNDHASEEGNDVGDNDTGENENNANEGNNTGLIQKFQ